MLETVEESLSSSQLRELKRFGRKLSEFGVGFTVCDTEGELVLFCDSKDKTAKSEDSPQPGRSVSRERLAEYGLQAFEQADKQGHSVSKDGVLRFGEHEQILASVLGTGEGEPVCAALVDLGNDSERQQQGAILSEMLFLLAKSFEAEAKAAREIDVVSTELAQVYEELVLLHKLNVNMKVTKPDANFLQMACDNLTDIVSVGGIAVLLEKTINDQKQLVLAAGSGVIDIDEHMSAVLYNRLVDEISSGKEALLDSEVDSAFKYRWPDGVENIIAVPLCGKNKGEPSFSEKIQEDNYIIGLMVAVNRNDKQDFDSIDVKLFNSVANSCAVFIENGRLFGDLKELFIGSLKALTNSIDAKDQYTHGHSERVAFISRWVAERLAAEGLLKEEQVHKVYLAGLLHDIGKMGIDEAVLRKNGKLTEEEFDRIKTHPSIGAGILGGIKQMRDIVPGVLYHHERVDGKGYPSGLRGEQVPLIGKIIGLADSFDAMTSKRTYRDALSVDEALAEIERCLGKQFDEKVGEIFLESDVYELWDIMQDGFGEIHSSSGAGEYGAVAVGALIR